MLLYNEKDQEAPENVLKACLMPLLNHKAGYSLKCGYNSSTHTWNKFVMSAPSVLACEYMYVSAIYLSVCLSSHPPTIHACINKGRDAA